MAVPAETLDAVMRKAPDTLLAKWQTIQDEMPSFPPNALLEFSAQVSSTLLVANHVITRETLDLVDDWYRQALATRANRRDPIDPVRTKDEWDRLSEPTH